MCAAAAEADSREADVEDAGDTEAAREHAAAPNHDAVPHLANGARDAGMDATHDDHGNGNDESGSGSSTSSSSSDIDDLDRASSFSSCDDDENDEGLPDDTTATNALPGRRAHHLHTTSMGSGGSGVSLAALAANPALGALAAPAAPPLRSLSSQLSSGSNNGGVPVMSPSGRGSGLRTQSGGGQSGGKASLPPTHWAVERVAAGIADEQQPQQEQPRPGTRALSPATPSPQPPRPAQVGRNTWWHGLGSQSRMSGGGAPVKAAHRRKHMQLSLDVIPYTLHVTSRIDVGTYSS